MAYSFYVVNRDTNNLEIAPVKSVDEYEKEFKALKKDKGWNPDGQDPNSHKFYLITAARLGNFNAVRALIRVGAKDHIKDTDDKTVLHIAAESGHFEMVKLYLMQPPYDKDFLSDTSNHSRTPVLLDSKDKQNNTPLHYAAKGGYYAILELLGKAYPSNPYGIDIDEENSLLETALSNRCEIDAAKQKDSERVVKYLIDRRKNIKVDKNVKLPPIAMIQPKLKNTLLHLAVIKGFSAKFIKEAKFIEILKEEKISIDSLNSDGYSPLQIAVQCGSVEHVELLLANGANLHQLDAEHNTLLHLAVKAGNVNTAIHLRKKMLANKKIPFNVNQQNLKEETVLHFAVRNPAFNPFSTTLILAHFARIDIPDKTKITPLNVAETHNQSFVKTMKDLDITNSFLPEAVKSRNNVTLSSSGDRNDKGYAQALRASDNENQPKSKSSIRRFFSSTWGFVKRNKYAIGATALATGLILAAILFPPLLGGYAIVGAAALAIKIGLVVLPTAVFVAAKVGTIIYQKYASRKTNSSFDDQRSLLTKPARDIRSENDLDNSISDNVVSRNNVASQPQSGNSFWSWCKNKASLIVSGVSDIWENSTAWLNGEEEEPQNEIVVQHLGGTINLPPQNLVSASEVATAAVAGSGGVAKYPYTRNPHFAEGYFDRFNERMKEDHQRRLSANAGVSVSPQTGISRHKSQLSVPPPPTTAFFEQTTHRRPEPSYGSLSKVQIEKFQTAVPPPLPSGYGGQVSPLAAALIKTVEDLPKPTTDSAAGQVRQRSNSMGH